MVPYWPVSYCQLPLIKMAVGSCDRVSNDLILNIRKYALVITLRIVGDSDLAGIHVDSTSDLLSL